MLLDAMYKKQLLFHITITRIYKLTNKVVILYFQM